MQQTNVIKITEPNEVMNALHNCGGLPPGLNTTAREILGESTVLGIKYAFHISLQTVL
jgi:hypothetical protein